MGEILRRAGARLVSGLFLFTIFASNSGFADSNLRDPNQPALTEKIQSTQTLIDAGTSQGMSSSDLELLRSAKQNYISGNEELGDLGVYEFLEHQGGAETQSPATLSAEQRLQTTLFLAEQAPDRLNSIAYECIQSLIQTSEAALAISEKHLSIVQRVNLGRNSKMRNSLRLMEYSLRDLQSHLMTASPEKIRSFLILNEPFLKQFENTLSSLLNHYSTFLKRSDAFSRLIDSYIETGKWAVNASEQAEFEESERFEDKIDVVFNRHTISTAALITTLVAEFATAPAMGEAIPPTIAALLESVTAVGNAIIVSSSALNIVDRVYQEGGAGLLNLGTAFDVLMIISALPRVNPLAVAGKLGGGIGGQLLKFAATAQYQAGYLLLAGQTGYGAWELLRADTIAQDLRSKDIAITADQIRMQGIKDVSIGILGGLIGYRRHRTLIEEYGSTYEALIQEAKFSETTRSIFLKRAKILNPFGALKKIGLGVSELMQRKIAKGSLGLLGGTLQLAYDTMVYQSLVLTSYTYADISFMGRVNLPDLAPGEIAVAVNGFDPTDLLYYAAHTDEHHRTELQKYKKGVNFFDVDFKSPKDLFVQLKRLSAAHGKIRYLKISTHGMPGHMLSRTRDIEGDGDEFIDTTFIQKNTAWIQDLAKDAMAPNAEVVLFSCLVGANLDEEMDVRDRHLPKNPGDQFIHALGNALLVNGGRIDSSRRIIMGLNGTFRMVADRIFESGVYDAATDAYVSRELDEIHRDLDDYNAWASNVEAAQQHPQSQDLRSVASSPGMSPAPTLNGSSGESEKSASAAEIASALIERVVSMHLKMYKMIYKYGINVEGGFFEERHRIDEFAAHAASH